MRGAFVPLLVGTLGGSFSKGPVSIVTELLECHFHEDTDLCSLIL